LPLLRIVLASMVMAMIVWMVYSSVTPNPVVCLLVGLGIYPVLLILSRVFDDDEVKFGRTLLPSRVFASR
jgi:hypothetical protein